MYKISGSAGAVIMIGLVIITIWIISRNTKKQDNPSQNTQVTVNIPEILKENENKETDPGKMTVKEQKQENIN